MPHKRNPITGERLSGLARVIRGNAIAALENVALARARHQSQLGRAHILPDSTTLLDYMLVLLRKLVDGLQVYPKNMKRNTGDHRQASTPARPRSLMLTAKGLERKDAYEAVQRAAMKTWKGGAFADNLKQEPTVRGKLSDEDIDTACAPQRHYQHVEDKFRAVGIVS